MNLQVGDLIQRGIKTAVVSKVTDNVTWLENGKHIEFVTNEELHSILNHPVLKAVIFRKNQIVKVTP